MPTSTPLSELQAQCISKAQQSLTLANSYFDADFSYDKILFDLRGKSAGQFIVKPHGKHVDLILRFNGELLGRYADAFIEEVVPHECAHLVVYQYYGRIIRGKRVLPHGREWKSVMSTVMKLTPNIRHNFDVAPSTRKQFTYSCRCLDRLHQLSVIRHNKVVKRQSNYLCKVCKTQLMYKHS